KGDLGFIAMNLKKSKNNQDKVIQIFKSNQLVGITTNLGKNGRVSSSQLGSLKEKEEHKKAFNLRENEFLEKVTPLIEKDTY
ncbi:MAG: hypothetical protein QGG43_00980, partial [Candidatus Marinimicrobia bacterium]|nr:hypothetical protein [Candidatus Neomarinimicrobiota bacterium]